MLIQFCLLHFQLQTKGPDKEQNTVLILFSPKIKNSYLKDFRVFFSSSCKALAIFIATYSHHIMIALVFNSFQTSNSFCSSVKPSLVFVFLKQSAKRNYFLEWTEVRLHGRTFTTMSVVRKLVNLAAVPNSQRIILYLFNNDLYLASTAWFIDLGLLTLEPPTS